jgi:protein gp37
MSPRGWCCPLTRQDDTNFLDHRWGESGGGARPMHPDWLRGLRDQVHAAAKLFVKQIGSNHALWPSVTGKGEDPAQWPADLRVQDFPQ